VDVHRKRKTTIVLATHDAALAARGNVILTLRGGRVDSLREISGDKETRAKPRVTASSPS